MSVARDILQAQFASLLAWERRKRLEQTALAVSGLALALAIALLPLLGHFRLHGLRWFMPLPLLLLIAPWFFHRWRWRRKDATRAMVQLDKTLNLAERATTAWELSSREATTAVNELVFKQAWEPLQGFAARRLFPRQWPWQSYAVVPLLILWIGLLWFEVDRSFVHSSSGAAQSLAHKVGEFSRELQEKARSEGLRESFKAGQELEKLARKSLEAKSNEEQLKQELAGIAKKFEAAAQSGAEKNSFTAGESQQALQDLRSEVAAARDLLDFPDAVEGRQTLPQQWMDRLESLPQLKRQLAKGAQPGPGLGANEMQTLLDRMEQQAAGELDRRTLIEAQKFLEQMTKSGQAQGKNDLQRAGRQQPEDAGDGAKAKSRGNLPGKEPGKKDAGVLGLPEFRGATQTQVKGLLGDGDSSAIGFRGMPVPGKSALDPQAVAAHYRRQAEQELNSERVPAALKETIRNYFLSLENSGPNQ